MNLLLVFCAAAYLVVGFCFVLMTRSDLRARVYFAILLLWPVVLAFEGTETTARIIERNRR